MCLGVWRRSEAGASSPCPSPATPAPRRRRGTPTPAADARADARRRNAVPVDDKTEPEYFAPRAEEGRGRPDDQLLDRRRSIRISTRRASTSRRCRDSATFDRDHADRDVDRRRRKTLPKGEFDARRSRQPGRGKTTSASDVRRSTSSKARRCAESSRRCRAPVIETLLMIRQPGGSTQVNKDWPLDKLLQVGAETFKLQIPEDKRKKLEGSLDGTTVVQRRCSRGLAQTHAQPAPRSDVAAVRQGRVRRSAELEDRRVPAAHRQGVDRAARRVSGGEGARAGVRDVPAAAGRRVRARAAAPRRGARREQQDRSSAWSPST